MVVGRSYHMATTVHDTREAETDLGFHHVSATEGKAILDRQARKYLGMSGEEFVRKYRAGEIEDTDRTDVLRVAMLISLAEQ
jgi:hypothetical protein